MTLKIVKQADITIVSLPLVNQWTQVKKWGKLIGDDVKSGLDFPCVALLARVAKKVCMQLEE